VRKGLDPRAALGLDREELGLHQVGIAHVGGALADPYDASRRGIQKEVAAGVAGVRGSEDQDPTLQIRAEQMHLFPGKTVAQAGQIAGLVGVEVVEPPLPALLVDGGDQGAGEGIRDRIREIDSIEREDEIQQASVAHVELEEASSILIAMGQNDQALLVGRERHGRDGVGPEEVCESTDPSKGLRARRAGEDREVLAVRSEHGPGLALAVDDPLARLSLDGRDFFSDRQHAVAAVRSAAALEIFVERDPVEAAAFLLDEGPENCLGIEGEAGDEPTGRVQPFVLELDAITVP